LCGDQAAVWKVGVWLEKEKPCWPFRRAGFSKIDDLCEILNYLPASFVLSSLAECAELGCELLAWTPKPPSDFPLSFPMRRDISAQCDHAVVCEGIGYVLSEFIGIECNAL
jgi:hypothetical protein